MSAPQADSTKDQGNILVENEGKSCRSVSTPKEYVHESPPLAAAHTPTVFISPGNIARYLFFAQCFLPDKIE